MYWHESRLACCITEPVVRVKLTSRLNIHGYRRGEDSGKLNSIGNHVAANDFDVPVDYTCIVGID